MRRKPENQAPTLMPNPHVSLNTSIKHNIDHKRMAKDIRFSTIDIEDMNLTPPNIIKDTQLGEMIKSSKEYLLNALGVK